MPEKKIFTINKCWETQGFSLRFLNICWFLSIETLSILCRMNKRAIISLPKYLKLWFTLFSHRWCLHVDSLFQRVFSFIHCILKRIILNIVKYFFCSILNLKQQELLLLFSNLSRVSFILILVCKCWYTQLHFGTSFWTHIQENPLCIKQH